MCTGKAILFYFILDLLLRELTAAEEVKIRKSSLGENNFSQSYLKSNYKINV